MSRIITCAKIKLKGIELSLLKAVKKDEIWNLRKRKTANFPIFQSFWAVGFTSYMKTRDKILQTAEQLIVKNGLEQVNLTDIAAAVGISQPALYKHFKNKNDIFATLAFDWLNQILSGIFPFESAKQMLAERCHDWLWTLANSKFHAYHDAPEMFALYTTYVGSQPELSEQHIRDLLDSFSAATRIKDEQQLGALLYLFSRFHHPYFASEWDTHFQQNFESCWALIEPYFDTKK